MYAFKADKKRLSFGRLLTVGLLLWELQPQSTRSQYEEAVRLQALQHLG
jgi:hypothetical protein